MKTRNLFILFCMTVLGTNTAFAEVPPAPVALSQDKSSSGKDGVSPYPGPNDDEDVIIMEEDVDDDADDDIDVQN